jgi:hypothetical protein
MTDEALSPADACFDMAGRLTLNHSNDCHYLRWV